MLTHWEESAKIGQLTNSLNHTFLAQSLSSGARLQSLTKVPRACHPPPQLQSQHYMRGECMNEGMNLGFYPPEQCACQ